LTFIIECDKIRNHHKYSLIPKNMSKMSYLQKILIYPSAIFIIVFFALIFAGKANAAQNVNYPTPGICSYAGWTIGIPDATICTGLSTITASSIYGCYGSYSGQIQIKPDLASLNKICQISFGLNSYAQSTNIRSCCNNTCSSSWWNGSSWQCDQVQSGQWFAGDSIVCATGCSTTQACTYHSYQQCIGNYLYWYDSCGTQQDSLYCPNGCYGNVCQNNNYYGNVCTYHAYKLCVGDNVYWYDSCGTQQDLYQTCSGANLTCQYGQCTYYQPTQPIQRQYVSHYYIKCLGNGLYWYDSYGSKNTLYKTCQDNNSCTLDSCSGKRCSNVLKCDGSTCAINSSDYATYCKSSNTKTTTNSNLLSVSFVAKQDSASTQWQKNIQVNLNGNAYFMISVLNNSTSQVDSVIVMANIPSQITSLGNLQVNGLPVSGDIVSGINIGSVAPGTSKSITFEGKTQTFLGQSTNQAVATINLNGGTQSDSLSINFSPEQTAASVSTQTTSGFMDFLKRWYLWILVALVLIFLFIVVFRRLSSNS
jgi:hypothetical protein